MRLKIKIAAISFLFFTLDGVAMDQKYEWLEQVESPESLEFVKRVSEQSKLHFQKNPLFSTLKSEASTILYAKDKLLGINRVGNHVYNFWQDEVHVRGIYRRMTLASYLAGGTQWETVLDLDLLSKEENENWVWRGANCLFPNYTKCLVSLSRGGKDATVMREFDQSTKTFVPNGFSLPESKMRVTWIDEHTLFVATNFGPGSMTESGYPRLVKVWRRGTALQNAELVLEASTKDVSAYGYTIHTVEKKYNLVGASTSFFQQKLFWLEDGQKIALPFPASAQFQGVFAGFFFSALQEDWQVNGQIITAGTLVALPEEAILQGEAGLGKLEIVFQPTASSIFSSVSFSKSHIYLSVLENVQGKIRQGVRRAGKWDFAEIPLGQNGVGYVFDVDHDDDSVFIRYSDFLTPPSFYYSPGSKDEVRVVRSSPAYFDASSLTVEQQWATSKDGTRVPYFLVMKKGLSKNGTNPTLLYGYGGFLTPMLPEYMPLSGKSWLERGGVYVLANIRGGGEFGPQWHRAAIKENKQRSYDDFIAIAEDLIQKKITSPKHLGIRGGSNGGLLVGATFTQRPDLFSAVICDVPLLDMHRYHLLLAGASWMEEYGDPRDPKMKEIIGKYSPFQNVFPGKKYPEVFFLTSTKDDRVHPGHARKMVAKMTDQGHKVFYYENTEGGHGGVANIEQTILKHAMLYSYLSEKLGNP